MAQVPYDQGVPSVAPQTGVPFDYQNIPTRPGEFGAHIAQGLQQAGAGATKATEFFGQVAADDAYNQVQRQYHDILFGDPNDPTKPGYYALKGADALKERPNVLKQLDAIREQAKGSLGTMGSALEFDRDARRLQMYTEDTIGRHADQQMESYALATQRSSKALELQAVSSNYSDPTAVANHTANYLRSALREAQSLYGDNADPAIINNALTVARSQAAAAQIEGYLAHNDTAGAASVLSRVESMLEPTTALKFRGALSESNVSSAVDRAMGAGGGAAPSSPIAGATAGEQPLLNEIRSRESGGHYDIPHPNGRPELSQSGAYQIHDDTWKEAASGTGQGGQFAHAYQAPPEIQDANALWLLRKYGPNATHTWAASGPYSSDTLVGQRSHGPVQLAQNMPAGQQAIVSGRPDYVDAVSRLENDPTLNPIERRRALSTLHEQFSFDYQLEERRVQEAEKNRKELQNATEADLFSRAVRKEPLDQDYLSKLIQARQLSPQGYNAIMSESSREEKGVDQQPATLDLWRRLGAGEDVTQDIFTAVSARNLSGPTADTMMKALNERQKTQQNQVERTAFSTLRTIAGMDATEHPMVDLGREANADQVALWGQAQTEWNRRVISGHEDPNAVLADMTPRYGHPVQSIHSLPRPRLGSIEKPDDVPGIAQKTQQAFDAGQLSQEQFRDEQTLILRYQGLLDAAQKRADAAKAAQGQSRGRGARAVGVTPAENP